MKLLDLVIVSEIKTALLLIVLDAEVEKSNASIPDLMSIVNRLQILEADAVTDIENKAKTIAVSQFSKEDVHAVLCSDQADRYIKIVREKDILDQKFQNRINLGLSNSEIKDLFSEDGKLSEEISSILQQFREREDT